MDTAMEEILKSIGWESGFRLPVANEENQALEQEMAFLLLKKGKLSKDLDDETKRLKGLDNHLVYVHQEVKQNQTLLTAYRQQLGNENNKFKLTIAERDKVNNEIRNIKKAVEDVEERQEVKKGNLARSIQKLERIKAEVSWDAEAMKAWEESLKRRDEDNELLKRFSVEDQRKMSEMEAKRVNLQLEVTEKRAMLEKMSQDIVTYEQSITRIGKILKQMNDERSALVRQWQEAVKNLRQRDQDIKRADRELDELQEILRIKRETLSEQNDFLNSEKQGNRNLEFDIEEHNTQNSKFRIQLKETLDEVSLLNNEVQVRKKHVESTAHELEKEQITLRNLYTELSQRDIDMLNVGRELEILERKLDDARLKTLSATERSKQIEEMVISTQRKTKEFEVELENTQTTLYRYSKVLSEAKEFSVLKQAEIKSMESTLAGIRKRFSKESMALIHQKQILSDMEMKVACIQAKLGNMEGENEMDEDKKLWNEKIQDLEAILAEHTEIKCMLQAQNMILQKESLRLVSAISTDTIRVQNLKDKLHGLSLMYEGGIKQVTAAKLRSQQKQVEENVLKLKVDKLNKSMNRADKEIYDLQKYRIDLETVMKERHIEIQTAREILLAKRKNLDEERGRLKADISYRKVKIGQLENKYELAVGCLGKDESGEPLSMAHFKIKAAQEKYILQQEGDDLDQKVRKAESEIVAMENTLKVVNSTNVSFRKSVEAVDERSPDAKLFGELEYILKERTAAFSERKKYYWEKQNVMKELQIKLKNFEDMDTEVKEELLEKQDVCTKLEKEEQTYLEKIARTDKQICHYKKSMNSEHKEKYDKELFIRQLQETSKNILYHLGDFTAQNLEVVPLVKKYFVTFGLDMPSVRTSMSSISSDSINTPSSVHSAPSAICNVTSLELTFGDGPSKPKKDPKKAVKKRCKKNK